MIDTKPLGEVVKLRKGKKAVEVHKRRINDSKPYIQIDEVRGTPPKKFASDPKGVDVNANDLCIVWDGANAGTVGYGVDGFIGSTVTRMRLVRPDEWDTRFIGRLLQSKFQELNEQARGRGATIPHVNKAKLEEISLPRIAKEEQRHIAAILDKADSIRHKWEQILFLAHDLLKSVFLEMFGNPLTNSKQFPTIALGDLIKVSSGNGLTAKDMNPSGPYPVYGGNGVSGFHSEYMFDDPQLVIGRVGVYCGAVHMTQPKSWVTDNALYIREYKKPVNLTYLEWVLRFADLNQYANQVAQPLISGSRIYPIEILFPSELEQDTFAAYVERQKRLLDNLEESCKKANDLFASLSQRAFRGNL